MPRKFCIKKNKNDIKNKKKVIKNFYLIAVTLLLIPSICFAKEAKISPHNLLEHIQGFSKTSTGGKVSKKKEETKKRVEIEKQTTDKVSTLKKEKSISNLDITIQQNINKTLVTFPWQEPAGIAVYKSSGYLWVIFDKKSSIKVNILNDFIDNTVIKHPIVQDYIVPDIGDKASCIMLKLSKGKNENNNFLLSKTNNSIDLSITDDDIKVANIDVISRPFDMLNQRIEFNIENLENTSIVSFIDPIVKDKVHVLTTNKLQYNVGNEYIFVDLDIMKSIQGIVIREKSDGLQIHKNNLLFWITSKSGLNISPKYTSSKDINFLQKSRLYKQFASKSGTVTLKPYVMTLAQFKEIEETLKTQLYASFRDEEHNVRINLALLYLANNYLPEAAAHLEYAYNFVDTSLLNVRYDLLLLYAVAKFMENQFQEAEKIINLIDIPLVPVKHMKEIWFWQRIINISNDNPVYLKPEFINKFFKTNSDFLQWYPENILSKIKFLAIKYLLKNKKYEKAKATIELLSTSNLDEKNQAKLYYEKANLYEQTTKNYKTIMEFLSKCINIDNSLYYSSLCQLKLTDIQLKTKTIDLNEAIKQLQLLDLDARNSKLEVEILERLASLFHENKDYINALLTWGIIADYYPHSVHVLSIIHNMGSTFTNIFLKNLGNYTPFQKVAIFDEFSDLNPIGDVGDAIALKLSDNLIDLDLLERATIILDHQIKYRLHGFIKEVTLNKLLELYLKLNQSKSVLKFFEKDKLDGLPPQIGNARKYIYAKTFAMEEKYDSTIEILKNDLSNQADVIRSSIYWKTQNWRAFNDNSEPYIYSLMQNDLPLTGKDAKKILMQSISYSFLNQTDLLENLISHFKNRLLENHKDTLDIINLLMRLRYKEKNRLNMVNTQHIQKSVNDIYNRIN